MNLVNLEAAVKAYGTRVLLDQVSLGVAAGDRIGLVGRNGSGKTTLLAALAGATDLNSGRSTRAGDARIGYLAQSERLSGTVREVVFGDVPEYEWAADVKARAMLSALIKDLDLDSRAEQLSGGEHRRVALAALLRGTHDLLLLDEPTNHLDIEAIGWLAGYLSTLGGAGQGGRPPANPRRAFVVVTHDRWFLDAVCDRTWELADGQVYSYEGGYSAYVLAKAERARVAAANEQRRQNLMRKELAWLRRGPPARTSKPKFRIEAATALIADEPAPRDGVELSRLAAVRLGKTVLDAEDLTVGVGDRVLLRDVTWQLGPGDRVGVVGVNGSGKTTLLQVLAGAVTPVGGSVVRGKTVRLGYLTQEPAPVDPNLRALEAAESVRGSVRIGKGELSAGQLLERLGFSADRQWTPVAELSGGERRRLQLQMVLMAEPNVLLLDEPTNDLDIETLTELEDLLDGFPGSIVVVSHDRYFLERVTDHVLALVGEKLAFLPGGIDEYLELVSAGLASVTAASEGPAGARADAAPEAGPSAGPSAARVREAKKELARIDRQVARLTSKESELHEALAKAASDYGRLIALGDELKAVQAEKANLEDRWLELAEETSS
ncbi:MAG TPA: ABC-F family ATP-binding cassette domain-containing protein [Streptosporangiaceae bacterium]|nr:ABC-F family ATP-binding cassette domain-containing protein [Streptosporangiaceae bacterium]